MLFEDAKIGQKVIICRAKYRKQYISDQEIKDTIANFDLNFPAIIEKVYSNYCCVRVKTGDLHWYYYWSLVLNE